MKSSHFDQLEVYTHAVKLVGSVRPLVLRLRREDALLADQLQRAAVSIPLNVAEGAGEFSAGDKARFYRYALRSGAEVIAILDVCREIELSDVAEHERCRLLGTRIIAMMTRLVMAVMDRDGAGRRHARIREPDVE